MTLITGSDPYDIAKLLKGPARVLRCPIEKTAPVKLSDIIEVESEYKPKTANGWADMGSTVSAGAYGRQFATAGYQIEQTTGNVEEDVTDVVRTISGQFAELDENFIQIMEQAAGTSSLAAAAGYSAEKQVKFGTITSLTAYRIAIIARRAVGTGADVTEKTGALVRGAMVACVLYRAKITADQAAIQLARGQLASAQLTFQAYPEGGKSQGQEHGIWLVEQTGTIT